jgi:peptidase C39-like protein
MLERIAAIGLAVMIFTLGHLKAASAAPTILAIPPVQQSTPEWCWLATGEMIFRYYQIPANAPDYQCGEARFQGAFQVGPGGPAAFNGPCWMNCAPCAGVGAGSVQGLVNMIVQYPYGMSVITGGNYRLQPPQVSLTPMSPLAVKAEIDAGRPIIAGITPGAGMMPPGLAQHAILIVGYDNSGSTLVINDPFPYQAVGMIPPYIQVGGLQIQPGRFTLPYQSMVGPINWNNAVYGIHP